MNILVTGGAGYIGSHACLALIEAGYDIVIVDNFSNSKPAVIRRLRELSGKEFAFVEADLRDEDAAERIFARYDIHAVMHFAGLKAVGESVEKPLAYYDNNLNSTLNLLKCMQRHDVTRFVFSSSATVYGEAHEVPIREDFPLHATNPYGSTKLLIERLLYDVCASNGAMRVALLRYFNPIGAHASGRIGEDPRGIPNNLLPYIAQVAVGRRKELSVFGHDYPTHDGTGVRDYIHVEDLARGHLLALKALEKSTGVQVYNLGTGKGYSVLDVVKAFESACGKPVPYSIVPRRAGDVAACYADPTKAKEEMGWCAQFDIARMCVDSWRWQSNNPDGYEDE